MEHEMNFFDLCVACCRAIGRGCAALGRLFARMIRLTYRYWWIVLTIMALGVAAALYYTRKDNLTYKVNAIAVLNGISVQQLEQAYMPLRSGKQLPESLPLSQLLLTRKVRAFDTYPVIDCLNDSVADYVDFKRKSVPTDTVNVQMRDRLCLQFRIKSRDLDLIPEVEQTMLTFLNSNPAFQRSYETYMRSMLEQARFNHTQAQKLDSLTTEYYFHNHLGDQPLGGVGNGFAWVGDWRVHLFLNEIYAHQERTKWMDQRLQLATAPVTLENHFSVDSKPVNGRLKFLIAFLLLGWIGGCILAEIIDKRKAIASWLKQ